MKKSLKLLAAIIAVMMLVACAPQASAPEAVEPTEAPEAAQPTAAPQEPQKGYTAGTYTATTRGMKGDLTVEVTFSETEITKVEVKDHKETYGIGYGLPTTPVEVVPDQIVAKQTLAVDAITGATITRAAILNAVADAVAQAGGDADALKAEKAAEQNADETVDVDVVIVGAGAAGLAAGIEATKAGAKVLIVEKQGIAGGATTRSGGKLLAAGTKWQEAQGIEDNKDLMFEYLMGIGGELLDEAKIRSFCESAYEHMLWLEEMGVQVQDVEPIHKSLNPWRVHNTLGGGGMTDGHGGQIIVPMFDEYTKLGGTISYHTAATALLTDASGKVVGLTANRKDGSTLTVNAKNVILATGGYAQNREMMSRYPETEGYGTSVPAGNLGDGLVMAKAVGADVFDAPATQVVYCSFTCGVGINEEAGLIVNNKGVRVANEYTYQYHVSDQMAKTGSTYGFYIACENDPHPTVQYGLTLDSTPKADSIEALAEMIGVDPAALKATVDRYNELCAKGSDDDFGKPADKMLPLNGTTFAAIKMNPAVTVTYGGLVTDLSSRVLRTDGTAIEGLYAAGEVAFTGLFGTEYPCCGMAIGSAIHFGRIAGQEAAK
ncbi:MAG: FAD-dependent oxidoreductase [Christensenellales bacterium]|jgi:flavocytochrome c